MLFLRSSHSYCSMHGPVAGPFYTLLSACTCRILSLELLSLDISLLSPTSPVFCLFALCSLPPCGFILSLFSVFCFFFLFFFRVLGFLSFSPSLHFCPVCYVVGSSMRSSFVLAPLNSTHYDIPEAPAYKPPPLFTAHLLVHSLPRSSCPVAPP